MLNKLTFYVNRLLICIAGIFLVAMILLTCANIFLRTVWLPVRGTFELMGFFGAIVSAFALGYTQMTRGHIAVDILFRRFSNRTVGILSSLNNIICALFFGCVSWQLAQKGTTLMQTGETTETLRIIYYPFTYGVALGCAFLTLIFVADLIRTLSRKKEVRQ
ncbi:C4-dicarboxylate ABC transporter permease, parti al [Desulfonema ishimotonii]|uniref:C4-dicarboxylate ABC transporter permease, parti al n=1 Tax=Desulfonema ishimotonii TaxID=45657 RepID=A0A401FQ99_9BACT|nr:TRAP transporter small permease [Desulfonema ishimotonii]GBC59166.1 C4-dicarboxylate ABC transporter permease, parti al [Desulfonema ishimotonii]